MKQFHYLKNNVYKLSIKRFSSHMKYIMICIEKLYSHHQIDDVSVKLTFEEVIFRRFEKIRGSRIQSSLEQSRISMFTYKPTFCIFLLTFICMNVFNDWVMFFADQFCQQKSCRHFLTSFRISQNIIQVTEIFQIDKSPERKWYIHPHN